MAPAIVLAQTNTVKSLHTMMRDKTVSRHTVRPLAAHATTREHTNRKWHAVPDRHARQMYPFCSYIVCPSMSCAAPSL